MSELADRLTTHPTEGDEPADPPPGVILAMATPGGIGYAVRGHAQRPSVPMDRTTRTDLGSVTKIVATTAAAMRLADTGDLNPDAPAGCYLPGLPSPVRDVPVEWLLAHRAGLWEWWPLYAQGATGADALAVATGLALRYRPGEARHYSDLGFILLGEIVARVTGRPLADAVRDLVLDPFGLTETRYARPVGGAPVAASSLGDAIEERMIATGHPYPVPVSATGFAGWRRHRLVGEVNDGNSFHAFGGVAGHAGLFSTAGDLARFGAALLASLDGTGPVAAPTARRFTAPGADPAQGLGFRRWPLRCGDAGITAIGHTGFPGVGVAVLPEHAATVIMVTNRLHAAGPPAPTEPLWRQALDAAHRALHDPEKPWT